jgi:hypothetical protein
MCGTFGVRNVFVGRSLGVVRSPRTKSGKVVVFVWHAIERLEMTVGKVKYKHATKTSQVGLPGRADQRACDLGGRSRRWLEIGFEVPSIHVATIA